MLASKLILRPISDGGSSGVTKSGLSPHRNTGYATSLQIKVEFAYCS